MLVDSPCHCRHVSSFQILPPVARAASQRQFLRSPILHGRKVVPRRNLATTAECDGYISYMQTKQGMTAGGDGDDYRSLPSVVTWKSPKCFMQARPKEKFFSARMPHAACADEAEHGVERSWHSLGCTEDEFRHIITSENAPAETRIRTQMVDLGNEDVCSDLRSKWQDGKLFLKDSGPGDLVKTSGATKSRQQTLVDTISDNLHHLQHFRSNSDHMTGAEMRQWLRASWQDSKKEGGEQAEDRDGPWTTDWVKDCSFDPTRSVDDTGDVLQPLLRWFNSAYPYYQQQCTCCGNKNATNLLATTKASPLEHTFEATRTELYHCRACESYYRIPRYNQIRKILEEGRGRCGEYSMIFYHLMSALGYNTRWIVDWSDHCWVEIEVGTKWVHMDPSVGMWNDKDMYKNDWNKRHMIILAFCQDGCQDVTEAYADNMVQARQRRGLSDSAFARALAEAQSACTLAEAQAGRV